MCKWRDGVNARKIQFNSRSALLYIIYQYPYENMNTPMLVRSVDVLHSSFLDVVLMDPGEGFCLFPPLTDEALHKILADMLFALPIESSRQLYFLPNPQQRFCLDLRNPIKWFKSRSMRHHLKDFRVVIKQNFLEELTIAQQYHEQGHGSTWLTQEWNQRLNDFSMAMAQQPDSPLQLYCFQLIEKRSGNIAAMTFGFRCGGFFEDYTMCTVQRDHRSCGKILTKIVGSILQQIGVTIWYWGYEVPYMRDFIDHYGGVMLGRRTFYALYREERAKVVKGFDSVCLPEGLLMEW